MFGFDPKKYHKEGSDSLGGGCINGEKDTLSGANLDQNGEIIVDNENASNYDCLTNPGYMEPLVDSNKETQANRESLEKTFWQGRIR